jgi:hypothetical protein
MDLTSVEVSAEDEIASNAASVPVPWIAMQQTLEAFERSGGWTLDRYVAGSYVDGPNGEECHKDGFEIWPNSARSRTPVRKLLSALRRTR